MIFNKNKILFGPGYLAALTVFFTLPVWSEGRATVQDPTPITLEIALATAFVNNPDILLAKEKVVSANENYREKRAKKYPSFGLEIIYSAAEGPSSEITNYDQARITVAEPLYAGGAISMATSRARTGSGMAQKKLGIIANEVAQSITKSYYEIVKLEEIQRFLEGKITDLNGYLAYVKKRQDNRLVLKNDVMMVQAGISRVRQLLIDNQTQLVVSKMDLASLLGMDIPSPIEVQGISLSSETHLENLNLYLERAQAKRIEISYAFDEYRFHEGGVAIAKSQKLPLLELTGGYGVSGQNKIGLERDWNAMLTAKMPIWDGGIINSQIGIAKSQLEQSGINNNELRKDIQKEVLTAYSDAKGFQEKRLLSQEVLDSAIENLRVEKILMNDAESQTKDILDAQNNYIEASISHMTNLYGLATALAQLEYSTGGDVKP